MDFVGDERAQSIQIGAVLLFAVLIIAFSSYQAFVVPDQNQEVEFNHNQQVHSQMQDLRNGMLSLRGSGGKKSVSVQLGTRYPSRAIAVNPGPASGSLRTVETGDESAAVTLENTQSSGETGDFWDETQSYNTGGLRYQPNYNLYGEAPDTVYDNTILYNGFREGKVTLANQSFIDGNEISLVMLNGSVSRSSSGSASIDVRSVSTSTEEVRIEDNGSPITVTFFSLRSDTYWDFLTTQSSVDSVESSARADGGYDVTVTLVPDQTYQLQLTKVGVGTQVTDENAAYLTDVDGDGSSVSQGETTELTLEVRDRYNNPPANRSEMTVEGSVDGSGSLRSTSETPDDDGQVTFVYEAPNSGTPTDNIQFSYVGIDDDFDATTVQNVSMTVEVTSGGGGGGGSAYSVAWQNPENDNDNNYLSDCSDTACTWDAGSDTDSTLTLRSGTSPAVEGTNLDFSVDDSSVGTISLGDADTDSAGEATTELTPNANGDVGVYVASGGSSDVIDITVENVGGGGGAFQSASVADLLSQTSNQNQVITFTPDTTIANGDTVTIDLSAAQQSSLDEVDYQNGGVSSINVGQGASFTTQTADDAEITWTSDGVSAGTQVRISVSGVNTGTAGASPYDVVITRDDFGSSTTTSFDVGPDTGGSELTNLAIDDLMRNTNGQTQTVQFEPTTPLSGGETVSVSLERAQADGEVDYQSAGVSSNIANSDATFTDQTADTASIKFTAPSSGLAADETVELTVDSVGSGSMSSEPYEVGFSRSDAGTTSTTFGAQTLETVEGSVDSNGDVLVFRLANPTSNSVTVERFAVDARPVNGGISISDGNARELEIRRTDDTNGNANRNGNPSTFAADGTQYDMEADSNKGTDGQYAVIAANTPDVEVDFRTFSEDLGTLEFTDSVDDADVTVTLVLSDGSEQRFYFSQQ